jgi:uncharacterized protein (TIGR03437 family)
VPPGAVKIALPSGLPPALSEAMGNIASPGLTIGGEPAKISYAGTAGTYNTWSVLQVNATVPDALAPGPQPLVLTIGASDNSQQQATIWVQ